MKLKFRKERYISQFYRNGKWFFRVRYKDISKTFDSDDYLSPNQAFNSAVEYRNRLLLDEVVETKITVNECFNEIENIFILRKETQRKYRIFYNKYIHNKNKELSKITRADILDDLNKMVDIASDDTINRVLSIWKKIFAVAIAKEYINKDITIHITPPKSHKLLEKKTLHYTDEKIVNDIVGRLKTSNISENNKKMLPLIIMTIFYTGMRPCECFALNKDDINLKKKTLRINKEVGSNKEKIWCIRICKTKESNRVIPLSNKVLPYIKIALKDNDKKLLFPNQDTFYTNVIGLAIHRVAKSIGYDFHLYQLRHAFITKLFLNGVDIKTIQELVGQKINATTIGYVVANENLKKKAIELI